MENFLKYISSKEEIEKGDYVCYVTATSDYSSKHPKTIKVPLFGIWDGKKVECWDKEKTTIRGRHFLIKVNLFICGVDKKGKEKQIQKLPTGINPNKIEISKKIFVINKTKQIK